MHRIPRAIRLLALWTVLIAGCALSRPVTRFDSTHSLAALAVTPLQPNEPTLTPDGMEAAPSIAPAPRRRGQIGTASYYDTSFNGRTTANGETYDEAKMTAAHRTLRFGTRVRVTNLENLRTVVVTVNDRGPFVGGRVIDLSRRAARTLGFVDDGTTRVRVQPL